MRSEPAVLVTAFNRPDFLEDRLRELRSLHEGHLFIAVDGPRPSNPDDARAVAACIDLARREARHRSVEVRTRPENLGCREGMIDGISWFLEQVGEGVIVEDDIRLGPSFLTFCSQLLNFHRDDQSVGMISGFPHAPGAAVDSYTFSWLGSIWGWATWADRWKRLHATREGLSRPPSTLRLLARTRSMPAALRAREVALWATRGVNTWDFWWDTTRVLEGMLTASAPRPLVQNVGGDLRATHTVGQASTAEPESLPDPAPRRRVVADREVDRAAAATLGMKGLNPRVHLPPEVVRALVFMKRRARTLSRADWSA